jgi:hypothetical protein
MAPRKSNPQSSQAKPNGTDEPARERRSSHRVADDQKSGQGSLSALSKMRMLERRRAAMDPRHKEPPGE